MVTRRLWCDAEAADYAREALSVPGLRLLLRVDSERRRAGVVTARETRYFASSLDPAGVTPADLLALVRGHWSVEIPQSDCARSDALCAARTASYHQPRGPSGAGRVV